MCSQKLLNCFDFNPLNGAKMTTVISTHLSHQINVQSKEVFDNFCQILVEMRNECDKKIFQPIIFDFRLCELFTIQVLFTTETLKEPSLMIEFYEPVLDLFNNEKVIFNLDTYLQMCDIMKWSYIICPYYWTRDSSVLDLVWKILNNNSNYTMQTIILLKQTIFWHEKLFGANFDHNKLNQVKIRIEKQITSQWIPNFQFNDTANELLFNIDEIIRRLFQNNFAEIVAEKSKYLELTSKANDFVFKSYILLDVYILWKGLLQYLDQQVEDGFSVSVISIKLDSTVGTYDLVMKLLYIYEEKGANLFKQSAKTENKFYLFVIRLWYSILINGIDKYYNFPAFQILNIYQLENGNLNCDKIKTLLKDDPFWSKLLQAYSSKLGFDEDYFNLFQIIQKLTSTPLDVNVMKILKRILNFTLNILIRTKLNEFEYFEKLFQMRCQIYGYGKLPIEGIEPMKSIIKETAFTKLKVDFNNANISKLSIDIISCAFLAPVDTYNDILNSIFIVNPLHYNKLIVHLMSKHLRPLSQCFTTFSDKSNLSRTNKLTLLQSMCTIKYILCADIISIESFSDYLNQLNKMGIIDFEKILINLLIYSSFDDVGQFTSTVSYLQTIYDIVKNVQFNSTNMDSFVLIIASFLKILYYNLMDQTKKEIIIQTIYNYKTKNSSKLDMNQLKRIQHMLTEGSIKKHENYKINYLLFYLEDCILCPMKKLIGNNIRSILYYISISNNSSWLENELNLHSNLIFNQLYSIEDDFHLTLTQQEMNHLIHFIGRQFTKAHIMLIISLKLSSNLDHLHSIDRNKLNYFARSLFILMNQMMTEIRNDDYTFKSSIFYGLLLCDFVWNEINHKIDQLKQSLSIEGSICNEFSLETKKIVQTIHEDVTQYYHQWKISEVSFEDFIKQQKERFLMQFKL